MNILTIDDFRRMLLTAQKMIAERADEFSQLDAVIGDGDHGTAIVQAMNAAVEVMDKFNDFKAMFNEMGFNVMLQTSGSTSTLLGGFLLGLSDASEGAELEDRKSVV